MVLKNSTINLCNFEFQKNIDFISFDLKCLFYNINYLPKFIFLNQVIFDKTGIYLVKSV